MEVKSQTIRWRRMMIWDLFDHGARYMLGEEPIWVTAQETKTIRSIVFKEESMRHPVSNGFQAERRSCFRLTR